MDKMLKIQTSCMELAGSSYEIGYAMGEMAKQNPSVKAQATGRIDGFDQEKVRKASLMFDRWCPGLVEEMTGFADALKVSPDRIFYYGMTYLVPRCSQITLLPGVTAEGKTLMARSYEFNHEAEDFCLIKTAAAGKYTHIGTSVLRFGREDGFNEHGLGVTMSSCGFPVGALPYMRAPKLEGLQYWAVIRALLENCRDVDEALSYLKEMPVAYNLNMIVSDKKGCAALVETLDGRMAAKRIGPDSERQMLYATNHAVLPELAFAEPQVMVHSARRYEYIGKQLAGKTGITKEYLKEMLLSRYPDGLCCHYYKEFFGTTKSMVLSPSDGTIELCWGGRRENGWDTYDISRPLDCGEKTVEICMEAAAPGTFDWEPIDPKNVIE